MTVPTPKPRPRFDPRVTKMFRDLRAQPAGPVWSAKSVMVLSVLVALLVTVLTLVIGRQRIIRELEISLGIIAIALLCFLAVGLYRGVRVQHDEELTVDGRPSSADWSNVDPGGCLGGDDAFGAMAGFLIWVVLIVVLVILIEAIIPVLGLALFWIFSRALRRVFAMSETCKGRWLPSLGYATLYTVLYTGWLFALLRLADVLIARKAV